MSSPIQSSNSGIVTDVSSGERRIPESRRPDGTTRKAIKIRPGYRPPEDVEVYKNRTAESFRTRGKGGVPGAEGLKDDDDDDNGKAAAPVSAAALKNAKRREARKRAKAAGGEGGEDAEEESKSDRQPAGVGAGAGATDPEAEKEKKARNLRKKLKQARDLQNKKETGESLLPEQIAKVIKISELVRELEALGFDAEGEPRPGDATGTTADETAS